MINVLRYAAILIGGSVILLSANIQTVRADGDHGGMMGGHMREGHGQSNQAEESVYELDHLLKHEKEIGLIPKQISKLKTMQLDFRRAQVRAEADIKVATLELDALVEDDQADLAAIQAKVDQLKKAEGSLLFMAIKAKRDAMGILTPEQRESDRTLRDKMKTMKKEETGHSDGMSEMKGMKHGKGMGHGKKEESGKEGGAAHKH
ncbi:MAG: hypothetical protein KIT39_12105 [Nitrospirales bacterium]|nr:hypothetical protein [Nitrospira sp.]MCW5784046.1 hypothetical protein [Nitrospirales bacterium]